MGPLQVVGAGGLGKEIYQFLVDLRMDGEVTFLDDTPGVLDARRCLEVILLRGATKVLRELADGLIGTKGVETGRLILASAVPVESGHGHGHGHDHSHDHGHHHD